LLPVSFPPLPEKHPQRRKVFNTAFAIRHLSGPCYPHLSRRVSLLLPIQGPAFWLIPPFFHDTATDYYFGSNVIYRLPHRISQNGVPAENKIAEF
jgi:hypothetical protein